MGAEATPADATEASRKWGANYLVATALTGAVLGVGLIHTTASVVIGLGTGVPPLEALVVAFSAQSIGLLLYHVLVGMVFGLSIGFLVDGMRAREIRQQTEAQELERRFLKAQKLESVGRLAGGVAHDFNNLLTALSINLYMAEAKAKESPKAQEHIREAARIVQRAQHLPRQLLAFSRRQPVEPKVVDVNGLIEEMRRMLERIIGEHITLVTALNPVGNVRIDPGQFEQVLLNLCVNARDAMPSGGSLTIETTERVLSNTAEGRMHGVELAAGVYVAVSVRDTGTGVPPEIQEKIFEPFFTTKPEGSGTGLGLATCDGIARQNGGAMSLASKQGEGSTFTLLLPHVDAPLDARPVLERPVVRRKGNAVVLVVDDQQVVREAVGEALRAEGYEVLIADTAEAALRIAGDRQRRLDLLLSDIVMPGMGGRELARRVSASRPHTRVLLMSGHADEAGNPGPAAPILPKPFTPERLAEAVREALDR